jgi:hypothetical protein
MPVQRFLRTLTVFFSTSAVALAIAWAVSGTASAPRGESGGRRLLYAWPEDGAFRDLPDRFDLPVFITFTDAPDSAVRLVVHGREGAGRQPLAGAFVEVSPRDVRLGRLEGGVAVERWSGAAGTEDGALPAGQPLKLELKRRGAEFVVTLDGRLAVRAWEPVLSGGRTAIALAGAARATLGRVSRLPEIPEFADDFMRTPEEPGPWEAVSGKWAIEALPTPSMSANAFSYRGRGRTALALAGGAGWDQYRFAASVRGEPGEAMGLAFAARPGRDHDAVRTARPGGRYVLFRWTSRQAPEDRGALGAGGPSGRREIVLVRVRQGPRHRGRPRAPRGEEPRAHLGDGGPLDLG